MRGFWLVPLLALAVLSFCQAFDGTTWLLNGNEYVKTKQWVKTAADMEDWYAAVFKKYNDTVIWYHITVTCPVEFFCAQFFYIRKMGDDIRLLEYTDFHCTEGTNLTHRAMVIMNGRDEQNVTFTPEYLIHHTCNTNSFLEYGGKFKEISTGIIRDEKFKINLPGYAVAYDESAGLPRPSFTPYMHSLCKYHKVTPDNKLDNGHHFYSPTVLSVLRKILYSIAIIQFVPPKCDDFERCRVEGKNDPYPMYIACSQQVYGNPRNRKYLYYSPQTKWTQYKMY